MENLNAEAVKKELEGLANFRTCPEYIKDTLALINSQEQRIKELTEENERLRDEQSRIKRKVLMEAASKFAGHSDYHGDAILCKLICMSEGKEVGVATPIDEVRRKETRADTVRKMQERLIAEFRKDDRMNYYIRMTLDQIAKEMLEDKQ